ncbi:site-specific integrase [Gordonia sp. HY285]|uniref:tyrosine-type recombinase/integrase n=1 Tax=Gordonia liuliyuniae TaxID=2911517 RepID=UPI001F37C775|nr:site-specific integrase [Gordonia liuliyuniae]MCF8608720.1 site-specific integrase [Gordonia liuliyuniae]
MASIRSRTKSDGTASHMVLWRHNGKQRSATFIDIKPAERFRANVDKLGPTEALSILGVTDSGELTLHEWLTEHIDSLPGIIEGTRRSYRRYRDADLATLGRLPLSAITAATVSRWLIELESADPRPSGKTIQNKHAFLSGALKAAAVAGKIERNPCDGQRISRTEKREMVFLSRPEFDLIHGAMTREPWADLALWLVSTGMRFGEATALAPSAIDLDTGTCRVSHAWKQGKSGRELGPPKSRRSVRTINLPPQAVEVARRRIGDGGDFVFVNSAGSAVKQQNFFNDGWGPARKVLAAKAPRIHDLRHTCASWMIGANVQIAVVSRHLGHEDITTTVNTYSHVDRESGAAAAAAIGRMLG